MIKINGMSPITCLQHITVVLHSRNTRVIDLTPYNSTCVFFNFHCNNNRTAQLYQKLSIVYI